MIPPPSPGMDDEMGMGAIVYPGVGGGGVDAVPAAPVFLAPPPVVAVGPTYSPFARWGQPGVDDLGSRRLGLYALAFFLPLSGGLGLYWTGLCSTSPAAFALLMACFFTPFGVAGWLGLSKNPFRKRVAGHCLGLATTGIFLGFTGPCLAWLAQLFALGFGAALLPGALPRSRTGRKPLSAGGRMGPRAGPHRTTADPGPTRYRVRGGEGYRSHGPVGIHATDHGGRLVRLP